jgi:enoyl-CoA hydratase
VSTDARRLITTQDGRVLTVTFNNPPRNFFDEQMSIELDDLTRSLRRDQTIGAVVFTGHGGMYMTHFDVAELLRGSRLTPFAVPYRPARVLAAAAHLAFRSLTLDRMARNTPARDLAMMARLHASLNRLNQMDKVIVTAINGLAFGMGCVFALACDIRLVAEGCDIGLTESSLNMLAAAGGTQRMVRMLGTARALELLLDGRWLTATEAADLGLVHRVVPADSLRTEAQAVAARLARRSPVINQEIKRMIYDAGSRPFRAGLRREAASGIATVSSSQAERTLSHYLNALRAHDPLTDDDIEHHLKMLRDSGVPAGPHRDPQ